MTKSENHILPTLRMRSSLAALFFLLPLTLLADNPPTRAEALAIAKQFAGHRYTPTARNLLHGPDPDGIAVETPDASSPAASGPWRVDQENTGIPYKWGGFDSLASFDTGLRAGKAAGDLYNAEKRRQGGAAVSSHAVGIDCSGFISRCWRLSSKRGTGTLPGWLAWWGIRSVRRRKSAKIAEFENTPC